VALHMVERYNKELKKKFHGVHARRSRYHDQLQLARQTFAS